MSKLYIVGSDNCSICSRCKKIILKYNIQSIEYKDVKDVEDFLINSWRAQDITQLPLLVEELDGDISVLYNGYYVTTYLKLYFAPNLGATVEKAYRAQLEDYDRRRDMVNNNE